MKDISTNENSAAQMNHILLDNIYKKMMFIKHSNEQYTAMQ